MIDFIRSHHGTTTVQYFYKQFITDFPDEEVDIKDFTYPGPKPFSKETAILMMSDSSEAAARSLKNPNAENIDALIEKVINYQINDNQFVNADITLKEITQLKKLFKKHGKDAKDTGSSEGQIALFTERINHLTNHLKQNRKDYNTERSLVKLVGKRRSLLDYLMKSDILRYRAIVKELGLRK